jgi:hypothetical protein
VPVPGSEAPRCAAASGRDHFRHADVLGDLPVHDHRYQRDEFICHPLSDRGFRQCSDGDSDGIPDDLDNCLADANFDQRDTDMDGFGNLCDQDLNNDCSVNFTDLGVLKAVFFTCDEDSDFDGDGAVNFMDLGLMKAALFAPPGPSGVPNIRTPN